VYLAAAAYNAGAGRVSRGLVRLPDEADADSLSSDATFFRLYDTKLLRRETKDYVPKLIAAALIAKQPDRYGFTITPDAPAMYDSIIVPDMTGLDVVARLADTTAAAVRELNPQYLRRATPPGRSSVVRLPAGRGPSTQLAYAELPANRRLTSIEHTVQQGETMSGIARRYRVNTNLLAQANPKINPRRLRFGQHLIVPTDGYVASAAAPSRRVETRDKKTRGATTVAARSTARRATMTVAKAASWHRVQRGETLTAIAEDYRVSVRELQVWNRLGSSGRIRVGQRLRISPPARATATPGGRSTRVAVEGATIRP
jgi:membrane-bound lytic murein transglycosylase D